MFMYVCIYYTHVRMYARLLFYILPAVSGWNHLDHVTISPYRAVCASDENQLASFYLVRVGLSIV